MFRPAPGFKAQVSGLTLLIASDFDEWKIILQGDDVVIQGGRQFTEAKAKEHAVKVAESYLREQKHEEAPIPDFSWIPLAPGEWLNWRP